MPSADARRSRAPAQPASRAFISNICPIIFTGGALASSGPVPSSRLPCHRRRAALPGTWRPRRLPRSPARQGPAMAGSCRQRRRSELTFSQPAHLRRASPIPAPAPSSRSAFRWRTRCSARRAAAKTCRPAVTRCLRPGKVERCVRQGPGHAGRELQRALSGPQRLARGTAAARRSAAAIVACGASSTAAEVTGTAVAAGLPLSCGPGAGPAPAARRPGTAC